MAVKSQPLFSSVRRVSVLRARHALFVGASAMVLLAALGAGEASADALATLRGAARLPATGAGAPSVAVPVVPGVTPNTNAATAAARALQNAAKVQQAVNLAQQAQAAGRQTAAALINRVPDGLGAGGLAPATNSAYASGGMLLWQGAGRPTQSTSTSGRILVDIKQTESRAILSWDSFNVGANTTLNFDQSQNGVAQPDWIVLNRVVGQLDPLTGLRDASKTPAPSQILGAITAQGTVLVINQNGVLFGGTSQINTRSLIATSLEVGRGVSRPGSTLHDLTIAERNAEFLAGGLLGVNVSPNEALFASTFSALNDPLGLGPAAPEGAITVEAGAKISAKDGGYILLAGPQVVNSGALTATRGQVSLFAGRSVRLTASDGSATSADPNVRGLIVTQGNGVTGGGVGSTYTRNTASGLIQSGEGYVSLGGGSAINEGVIAATTSVARNGYIELTGADVRLAPGGVIAITPDDTGAIPQDAKSLAAFKPSKVALGGANSRVEIASGSLIYAPGATVEVGVKPGILTDTTATAGYANGRIFVDSGATIDVAGLKNVVVPASRNVIVIDPVKGNELADSPLYRQGFLNGARVYLDPRISGVRADGVAYIGSPLVSAESYARQVGVTASELLTKGGNVTLGVVAANPAGGVVSQAPDVIVKRGATIDISGGWRTFEAGRVRTTRLIDSNGGVVDIGYADPNATYVGVYEGFMDVQPRFGVTRTYVNPIIDGGVFAPSYTEGADAGALTIKSSQPLFEGTLYADAFPGLVQSQTGQVGTAKPLLYGDQRRLQAVASQLPSGGLLSIQGLSLPSTGAGVAGGGDIRIVEGATPVTGDGLSYGQSVTIDAQGNLSVAARPADSMVPAAQRGVLTLGADTLSAMGLGQLALSTSGGLTIEAGAEVSLTPGGVFSATTGRAITIDGDITAASGLIALETVNVEHGSVFKSDLAGPGSYDIAINGRLSTAGLWIDDQGASEQTLRGAAYVDGGKVSITAAPRELLTNGVAQAGSGAPAVNTDISGSILIDGPRSRVDVSSGGYVAADGGLDLTARGGDVTLTSDTTYFQLSRPNGNANPSEGQVTGIRGAAAGADYVSVNPGEITARISIGQDTIVGHGFAGGGTFSLTTPAIAFGDGRATTGTELPLDFFSKAGFSTYKIKSYGTDLSPNAFSNGLGGYNAVLKTQVLTVGQGQTLDLTQSRYSIRPDAAQSAALRALGTGGAVTSVLTAGVQPQAWDQAPISLTFDGLIELKVVQGGQIIGAPGAQIGASQILNQGTIRLAGGTINQVKSLPTYYADKATLSAASLSHIFSINPDGAIDGAAASRIDPSRTNQQVAADGRLYLTGDLAADVGIQLDAGSVTDLSGTSVRNPYAIGVDGRQIVTGRIYAGGAIATAPTRLQQGAVAPVSIFSRGVYRSLAYQTGSYSAVPLSTDVKGSDLVAAPGALVDLSGTSDTFDQLQADGRYAPTLQWSRAGVMSLGAGGALTGATILAKGGAAAAAGGTLVLSDATLTQADPSVPTRNLFSANQIEAAGFDTLVVRGALHSQGDVDLTLDGTFELTSAVYDGLSNLGDASVRQALSPVIGAGGQLDITASHIRLDSAFQSLATPDLGAAGTGAVTLHAKSMDVAGAVLFDRSVASTVFDVAGDLRFSGVAPYQIAFGVGTAAPSLAGQMAVNGNLLLRAGQVYATTGSSFAVTSTASNGVLTVERSSSVTPSTPYSAGSALTLQAASIVQNGVVRAPLGALTLGSNTALVRGGVLFAPATGSVVLGGGGVTSVSAGGLSIPYGTTTDQTEYFFNPTNANPLAAPPTGVLTLAAGTVTTAAGATVDISGGGDVYAYEFIPGPGGSRDVLSQFNPDVFTGNDGYQYADHRQVYAIVPGLSDAAVSAYDPIYSANYGELYQAAGVGRRVYLEGGPGLAAGWYTLLPAQYALLPGGMRVVEETGAAKAAAGATALKRDGTLVTTGRYGGVGGAEESQVRVFEVQNQAVIQASSKIVQTSANAAFAAAAAKRGQASPLLPMDAGRLVFAPLTALDLNGKVITTPGKGGRGGQADISGQAIEIVAQRGAPSAGVIQLDAAQLSGLNVDSLLIGGVRTDRADGSTALAVTANTITVANNAATPLTGPEILLAVDGAGSRLTIQDGATITATASTAAAHTGDFLVDGAGASATGQGALVRVSSGPDRDVVRSNLDAVATDGLVLGAATLTGRSVLLDSSAGFDIDPNAVLAADTLTLSASQIHFAAAPDGLSGLVLTPGLQAGLGRAQGLRLRTANLIDFANGDYHFGDLSLVAPGIALADSAGQVRIFADDLRLESRSAATAACGVGGALACGTGRLTLDGRTVAFGDGALHVYGAGGGVAVNGGEGVFYDGKGSLDVGAADLTIQTPFFGDRARATATVATPAIPSFALTTTGALVLTNDTGAARPTTAGVAGASLALSGRSLTVGGVDVRATAGKLSLTASDALTIGVGALIETPGYARSFGDKLDPYSVSAPGGQLTLTSLNGDVRMAAGSTLSVGGGLGAGGTLSVDAAKGSAVFGGVVDASTPDGGARFALNQAGGFDLSGFVRSTKGGFDGGLDVQTGAGDLVLAQGLALKARNVSLVADGGRVAVDGAIDSSGVNGGDIRLFGADGVALGATAVLNARGLGYDDSATRTAKGGTVQLGVGQSGGIDVAAGARIDVGVKHDKARLVATVENGVINYRQVAADTGGALVLRAPVLGPIGGQTVEVDFAGSVVGADKVVLEGYRAFDLAAIAADSRFTGVSVSGQTATLNLAATAAGRENFLGGTGGGTLSNFIQTFDVSDAYDRLGGLAGQANFHARPGVELNYDGAIVLASNWNLGAGTVDVAGAMSAGLMAAHPGISGAVYVVPGSEGRILADYTDMTYHVGGKATGEAGVLTLRATDDVTLNGSLTDGFFTFADQSDPAYLNRALGGGTRTYDGALNSTCTGSCVVGDYAPGTAPANTITVNFPATLPTVEVNPANPAPYNAAANSAAALGAGPNGDGDAIGSAVLFPLIQTTDGVRAVESWSYQVTAGARMSNAGVFSVDPLRVEAGATANLVVAGTKTYSYGGVAGTSSLTNTLLLGVANGDKVAADQWVQAQLAANPGLTEQSYTRLQFNNAPVALRPILAQRAAAFFAQHPGEFTPVGPAKAPTGISTTLELAGAFLTQVAGDWATLKAGYSAPRPTTPARTTVTTTTLMRTGTGSIALAAAGDIDLRNSAAPTYRNILTGEVVLANNANAVQTGGVAVYTAGRRVIPTAFNAVDPKTGQALVVDPSSSSQSLALAAQVAGGGVVTGLALAQPVYATGGGDVSLVAGGDVLSRRDLYTAAWVNNINPQGALGYVGTGAQPWRMGFVGMTTDLRINPQLFSEGVGTLGGGDILVAAGGDVIDLSVVADTTVTTANVAEAGGAARPGRALLTFGGGDVTIEAGGDLAGGRIDVGAGQGKVRVGGDLTRAEGSLNGLRLRLTDATIDLSVRGEAQVEEIAALGVRRNGRIDANDTSNANALGFYSQDAGVSVVSNGNLTFVNSEFLRNQGGASPNPIGAFVPQSNTEVIYPGSLSAVSLAGDLSFGPPSKFAVLMVPSARGTLTLVAGGAIAPATIAMLDNDPGLTPGVFSSFAAAGSSALAGRPFDFPVVLPTTSLGERRLLHNALTPRLGDQIPNRIYAGGDISNLILSLPKQTRIGAGRDIVNMMFFGQNLNAGDITRIVAGRDITATTVVAGAPIGPIGNAVTSDPLPMLMGNTFVIGGPGTLSLEAGRDLGPFLNSAVDDYQSYNDPDQPQHVTFGGGVMSVGNDWNPWLAPAGANLDIQFGIAKGADFTALRETYLDPANLAKFPDYLFVQTEDEHGAIVTDRTKPIYGPLLVAWMQANAGGALDVAFGTTKVDYAQAYQAFTGLSPLRQRTFLQQIYFNELTVTSTPGPSFQKYSRGYTAVNTLFPAALGYTANDLTGGSNGANLLVQTGDLDLRLATIQTARGGDISILGPGGRVLAGSTVSTAQQAARRNYDGRDLFSGQVDSPRQAGVRAAQISAIPTGFEGVLSLRGGDISTFTDGDFVLNQSRVFTEQGGDVAMWSSNGDLNAGQGPKTSANFPPVVVKVSDNANSEVDQTSAVSGAGIAAFQPAPGVVAPNVYLIAPRGTVDAGDAGVRVAGNLFVAALTVANADNFKAGGSVIGVPTTAAAPVVGAETSAAGNAVTQAAQQAVRGRDRPDRSIITVDILGFGDPEPCPDPRDAKCPPR